jgi:hypothetical protein
MKDLIKDLRPSFCFVFTYLSQKNLHHSITHRHGSSFVILTRQRKGVNQRITILTAQIKQVVKSRNSYHCSNKGSCKIKKFLPAKRQVEGFGNNFLCAVNPLCGSLHEHAAIIAWCAHGNLRFQLKVRLRSTLNAPRYLLR